MAWLSYNNLVTALGTDTQSNIQAIENGLTGIQHQTEYNKITDAPVSVTDLNSIREELSVFYDVDKLSRFESLALLSLFKTIKVNNIETGHPRILFILSTTKGNIDRLGDQPDKVPNSTFLHHTAKKIAWITGFRNSPIVVCNACISGVLALIMSKRLVDSGRYDQVVVTGADIVSGFVVAGFESFKSMSGDPCRPFDKDRDGLSLGEGAATLVVSGNKDNNMVKLIGGGSANDANHISGPSRTGEGLFLAAANALQGEKDIDFISAHGTGTPYNDDMESHAIKRLGFEKVPVNSFKGYFGHTLGAAGIIETILTQQAMINNTLYASRGFENLGVANNINVINSIKKAQITRSLKLASGFGGCNAAILLEKENVR